MTGISSDDMAIVMLKVKLENDIQEAIGLLKANNYIVIKMTSRMLKDAKECDEMEGDKDCLDCSCNQCVLR